MINAIKQMINEKQSFQEAANIIIEDTLYGDLDDLIVLGEDGEADIPDGGGDIDSGVGMESEEPEEPDDGDEEPEDLMDAPVEDTTDGSEQPVPAPAVAPEEDDLMSADSDETPMPLPGDDLPTPVGAQTGEPINSDDDLMSVTLDLRSNTLNNTLPIPPANAAEAIPGDDDDLMSQKVDSGFGESAMVLTADKLKGYHIEDIPYLIYSTSCKKKNKTPVSKDEFNTSTEFKKLKSNVYSAIADFIRSEKFTVVRESPDVVILDYDEITESTKPDSILEMSINDIPYEIYKTQCLYEGKRSVMRGTFDMSMSSAKFRNDVLRRFSEKFADDMAAWGNTLISEAISLGDDGGNTDDPSASDDDAARSAAGGGEETGEGDVAPDETSGGEEENDVTSAVRDKVAEADDDSMDMGDVIDSNDPKKKFFNDLSSMTKKLEDLKKSAIDVMP